MVQDNMLIHLNGIFLENAPVSNYIMTDDFAQRHIEHHKNHGAVSPTSFS